MGFSNVIYKYPRFKDTTLSQIFNIENYHNFDSNEWAQKNFKTAEEYMDYNDGCNKDDYVKPTQEQLDFYKSFMHKDEFDHFAIRDYVYYNCSQGIQFDNDLKEILDVKETNSGVEIELTRDDVIKLLTYEVNRLKAFKLVPAFINNSFTRVENGGDDYIDDDPDVIIKKCDGVEITFEDGTMKRIETNSKFGDWGTLFMTTKEFVDEWDYDTQFELVQTLAKILETTDFDKECLSYCGGW